MEERPRILIVEDDPYYREFLTRVLETDYTVHGAADGNRALNQLERHAYDAILCDLRVPGPAGKELVTSIRRRTDEDTILIVVTGFEQDWSPVEATEASVYFYLKKGQFSPKELRKVLKNGIDLRKERLSKRRYAEQLERLNRDLEKTVEERTRSLRESEARYRSLFEQSLVGTYIEKDGRILMANERLCKMLGYPPGRLAGKPIRNLLAPVCPTHAEGDAALSGLVSNRTEEVRLKTSAGSKRSALHCAGTVRIGGTEATQGCIVDITEWKEMEQQLLQHQKMESLGTLVSGIAHEFNNILAAMMPHAEMLVHRAREIPTVQRPAQVILSMAEKASRLTRQLLNMSRKPESKPEIIDVNTWLRETVSFLATTIGRAGTIQFDLDPLAGRIVGDPHQLDQVLLNLILNARDAMPEGGAIHIASSFRAPGQCPGVPPDLRRRSCVEIRVQDAGCGIPKHLLPKIFDPFFTTKEAGKGTGLGLSVAYNVVKQHGGEILVESQEGKGSVFRVLLPQANAQDERASGEHASCRKVLVADTNPNVLNLFRDVLSKMNYEIIPARSRQEAEKIYASQKDAIDCVILDERFGEDPGRPCLGRFLELNPRVKMILTRTGASAPQGGGFAPQETGETRIRKIHLPLTPEDLSLSLQKVLHGGSE